jgi:hypothetical protein
MALQPALPAVGHRRPALSQRLRRSQPQRIEVGRGAGGYNAGPEAVKRAGNRIPDNGETPQYVARVMRLLAKPAA